MSDKQTPAEQQPSGGFIARQAVFDDKRNVWGYELLYRNSLGQARPTAEEHRVLLSEATSSFLSPHWQQRPNASLLVNLDPRIITEETTGMLPKGHTVFQVREEMLASPALRTFLEQLKGQDYQVAITNYTGQVTDPAVLKLANLLTVELARAGGIEQLAATLQLAKINPHLDVLAKKVDDQETYQAARDAGCSLFQGFYFQKPEKILHKTMPASLAASLGILKLVEQPQPDLAELAAAIQKDVSLSFRLLKFLNSPYFGFAREVSSIKVALILAGWEQMRTWLRLVLITDMTPKGKPSELIFLSAQRSRFLELAAKRAATSSGRRLNSERLLLLGLFSLLDSIFDMNMPDIVDSLPLDTELKATLCEEPTVLQPWLTLVRSFERADWAALHKVIEELHVAPVQVAACYTESMQWAHGIFNFLK